MNTFFIAMSEHMYTDTNTRPLFVGLCNFPQEEGECWIGDEWIQHPCMDVQVNVCLAFSVDSFYWPWCLTKKGRLKLIAALQRDTNESGSSSCFLIWLC